MSLFAFLLLLLRFLAPAPVPAAPAPVHVVAHAGEAHAPRSHRGALAPARSTPARSTVPLCSDGTNRVPVAGGALGCPGPDADPGPVGVPPGFVAVDVPPAVPPGDPCFRGDPECYGSAPR